MALDKAIKYGKEKRKQYRKSKAFDRSCRNHGRCSYCEQNRLAKYRRAEERLRWEELDFRENIDYYGI